MDFSELLHGFGFAEIEKWISLGGYMDLSKLLHGQCCAMYFLLFVKQNQAEV